jgi:hypothetical protein
MSSESPITRLARVFETARPVPLMRQQIRVDRAEVMKLADSIACPSSAWTGRQPSGSDTSAVTAAAVDAVRDAVQRAHRIPFTDQVRLPAHEAAALLADLRRVDTA